MGKFGDSNSNKYCSVPQCKSRCTNEISLFRFPKEESLRKKWADAIKFEKGITEHMQVCSRHFVKNDYILSDYPGASKVRRLKKSAVPSQNLPWQFPNKRVSPTLAKARMERLKNRTQQKISDSPDSKSESTAAKKPEAKKPDTLKKADIQPENQKESPKKSDMIDEEQAKISTEDVTVDIKLEDDEIEKLKEEAEEESADEDVEEVPVKEVKTLEAKNDEKSGSNTRAPTRLRQREGILKCEYCGRKCLTPQALQTHQHIAHRNARNQNGAKKDTTFNKPKPSPKPVPVALISVKSPEKLQQSPIDSAPVKTAKLNNSDLVEKVLRDDSDDMNTSDSDDEKEKSTSKLERQDRKKTEFECPRCRRRFAVYFMATKHIQKHHSMLNGSKLPNNLLPKPTRIEICTVCLMTLDSDVHVCAPLRLALGFICTGCEQEYKTLTLFDMHKSSMHSDGVESMFFPTLDEFELWKQKMEIQTGVKYHIMDQSDTKTIHRCTHRAVLGAGHYSRQRMCPSTIIVQEFSKGFQVHYYAVHYGHDSNKYGLANAFKKYSISSLMNLAGNKPPENDDEVQTETDLYLQFKKLTDVLVNEAARINVNGLKILMRKALEMFNVVNSYVEDDEDDVPANSSVIKVDSNKDDLQDQVKTTLSNLKRRPTETIEATLVKRKKPVFQSKENTPKGIESVKISNSFSVKDEIENCQKSPQKLNQSPSFIDSFQNFVKVKGVERKVKAVKRNEAKKVVKTKMGQFKPSPPKKVTADSPKPNIGSPKTNASPKLNSSPKSNVASPKTSVGVKDIEYEVKEQENDCNILILKI